LAKSRKRNVFLFSVPHRHTAPLLYVAGADLFLLRKIVYWYINLPKMDTQNSDEQYIKRVNDGYLLAQYMPELAEKIKQAVKEKEDGLVAGIEQFGKELIKDQLPGWMQRDRFSDLDKDKENEKNEDDLERE
jgi:hypothetical protein